METSKPAGGSKTSATGPKSTASGTATGTAITGGARGRGDNKATVLMVWVAVALGGLGAGMISWG